MIQPIVLAAGLGTRLGSIKALIIIGGQPALSVVLNTIHVAGLSRAVVVLGHDVDTILESVPLPSDQIVVNHDPGRGLSGSLKIALDRVDDAATGVIVFHVDMPYVDPATVRIVVGAAQAGATLAAPEYRGRRGFPVYFQRTHLAPLRSALHGDCGGQEYLRAHQSALVRIAVEDPGCVHDIDTADDLRQPKGATSCATND